jgi:hypothetical protein
VWRPGEVSGGGNAPDKITVAEFLVFVGGLWSLRRCIELFRSAAS